MSGVIVALDLPDAESAVAMAAAVANHVEGFQVGLGLLLGPGPLLISALVGLGKPVLADAKLHDTPSRVEAAARQLGRHGARWVSAHVTGGQEMLEAAVEGLDAGSGNAPAGIFGVTVLDSLDRASLARVGIDRSPGKLVARMGRAAAASGCEGVMSSPHELTVVADVAPGLLKVTSWSVPQGRAGERQGPTPLSEAIARGADLVVIGGAITAAADPRAAAAELTAMVRGSDGAG